MSISQFLFLRCLDNLTSSHLYSLSQVPTRSNQFHDEYYVSDNSEIVSDDDNMHHTIEKKWLSTAAATTPKRRKLLSPPAEFCSSPTLSPPPSSLQSTHESPGTRSVDINTPVAAVAAAAQDEWWSRGTASHINNTTTNNNNPQTLLVQQQTAAVVSMLNRQLTFSALVNMCHEDSFPIASEAYRSVEGVVGGVLTLARRAHLSPEEITEECFLTLLWQLHLFDSQYETWLSNIVARFTAYHPRPAAAAAALKPAMLALQVPLLERCDWNLRVDDDAGFGVEMSALEKDQNFLPLCRRIKHEAVRLAAVMYTNEKTTPNGVVRLLGEAEYSDQDEDDDDDEDDDEEREAWLSEFTSGVKPEKVAVEEQTQQRPRFLASPPYIATTTITTTTTATTAAKKRKAPTPAMFFRSGVSMPEHQPNTHRPNQHQFQFRNFQGKSGAHQERHSPHPAMAPSPLQKTTTTTQWGMFLKKVRLDVLHQRTVNVGEEGRGLLDQHHEQPSLAAATAMEAPTRRHFSGVKSSKAMASGWRLANVLGKRQER